jgi:hypothetical protein
MLPLAQLDCLFLALFAWQRLAFIYKCLTLSFGFEKRKNRLHPRAGAIRGIYFRSTVTAATSQGHTKGNNKYNIFRTHYIRLL